MASQASYEVGDRVLWRSGQGESQGTVQEILQEAKTVDGNAIDASEENPRYLVENDSTGKVTGHTADALTKVSGSGNSNRGGSRSGDRFEKGDEVQWNSAQGKVKGEVKQKLTSKTQIEGHIAKASKDNPQYLVESDSTGSQAAHKPSALESV